MPNQLKALLQGRPLGRGRSRRGRAVVLAALLALVASPALQANAVVATFFSGAETSPFGVLFMGTHFWVSDHVAGFCRLDPNPDGTVSINQSTCHHEALAPTAPDFDPATDFVYVGDTVHSGGAGVERYHWDPGTELIDAAISLAPSANLAALNPMAVALAPDGQLYIGGQTNPGLFRISNPAAAPADVPFQQAPQIGTNGGLRQTRGLTFIGPDLWVSNGIGIYRIQSAAGCTSTSPCTATKVQAVQSSAPLAIGSDGSDVVWFAESPGGVSYIDRYTISTNVQDVMATQGTLPDGTTTGFAFTTGRITLDPSGSAVFGDDPTAGSVVGQGRLWKIPAGSVPAAPGTPGSPGVPPATTTNNSAPEIGTGVTAPSGGVFLTNASGAAHFWVSDAVQGLCRMDGPAADGTFRLNSSTCSTAAVKPGQPSFDPGHNFVYVPDFSSHSQGVWRLAYNPTSDTLGSATLLAPGAGVGGGQPEGSALDPFDGSLYVSFNKNGDIDRITTPAGSSQTVVKVGAASDGRRVRGLTFAGAQGRDLYLAAKANVEYMPQADRCSVAPNGTCGTIKLVQNVGPQAIDSDGGSNIYWLNQQVGVFPNCPCPGDLHQLQAGSSSDAVVLTTGVLPTGTAVRIQLPTGVSFNQADGSVWVGDDPNGGVSPLFQGHVWRMTPTQADLALGMAAGGTFAPGGSGTLTLTVTNGGPFSASPPVIVTDSLPAAVSFVSSSGTGWTCSAAAQIVTCTNPGGMSGAGASSQVTLDVSVGSGFTSGETNTAVVTSQTSDPTFDLALSTPNNNIASLVLGGQADVSITGSASPEPVVAGQNLTDSFTIANAGPSQADATAFSEPVPVGTTFVSAGASQGSCGAAAGTVTCSLGVVGSGATATVTVVVTPAAGATSPITATGSVQAAEGDPNTANNSVTLTSTISPTADVAVSTTTPGPATAGGSVSYTATVSNGGPSGATGVTLTDTLPAGSGFVSATPQATTTGCTQAGATVTCSIGSLASGASTAVTIVVTVPSPGAIANITTVGASEQDPNPANNSTNQVSIVS